MVWHAALWATMKKYNISTSLIRVIKNLYDKATSAVLFNSSIGDLVPNNSSLTHPLQHISGKDHDRALKDHEGTVSIGVRAIASLCFADDIDGLVGEDEELAKLVERLDKASTAYGMEISAEKTKLMTNQWHQHRNQSEWTEV